MKKYKDLDKNSKIDSYTYNDHQFVIRLKDGEEDVYEDADIGYFDLANLKQRAKDGRGLDEYIKKVEERSNNNEQD